MTNCPDDYFFLNASHSAKNWTDKYYKSDANIVHRIRYKHAWYSDHNPHEHHKGIQIDIFVLNNTGSMVSRWYLWSIMPPTSKYPSQLYKTQDSYSEVIHPLKELLFEDFKIFVPNKYDEYLRIMARRIASHLYLKIKDRTVS